MTRQRSVLQHIENNEAITNETHYEFLFHLEHALLLALREHGTLTAMQYRRAEERLTQQRRDRAKRLQEEGNHR